MNQIWIVSSIFIDGATAQNFGSVYFMDREKIGSDGNSEYISVFFSDEKSAKNDINACVMADFIYNLLEPRRFLHC